MKKKKFKPTMKLRWAAKCNEIIQVGDPVLQQLWVWSSDDGDESEEEWRDVPVVEVEA